MSAIALLVALAAPAHAQEAPPIVGGSRTSDYEQVGALVALSSQGYGSDFCSGTLVHRKWVVTAAHCIEAGEEYEDYGYDVYFVLGTDLYNDSWIDYAEASRLIAHPGYNGNTLQDDIGLMELSTAITSVDPMPMNTQSPSGFGNIDITYVGFGITGDGRNDSGTKRTVDVAYYGYDSMFIYTYENGVNICSGDSGGAALVERGGTLYLAGANSFGFDLNGGAPDCEGNGAAAGSARVDGYRSWIDGYVPDDDGGGDDGGSDGGGDDGGGSDGGGSDGSGSDGGGSDGGGSDGGGDDGPSDDPEPGDVDLGEARELGSTEAVEFPAACSATGAAGGTFGLAALGLLAGLVRRRED